MPRTKGVVFRLRRLEKPRQTTFLPQAVHAVPPASKNLVGIGLVAHIPDQAIPGRIEDIVQRNGKLHHAQSRRQMSTRAGNALHEKLP